MIDLKTLLEGFAVVTSAGCTYLLAKNRPLGWWVAILASAAYIAVFWRVRLFAEAGIQVFYIVTSLQGIYVWMRGGANHTEKPVSFIPRRYIVPAIAAGMAATVGLYYLLVLVRGAAPFWDSLTTVLAILAQLMLMARYVENWYLWIAADLILVPLYASRGLYLTALLYVVFLYMAVIGLRTFRQAVHPPEDVRLAA